MWWIVLIFGGLASASDLAERDRLSGELKTLAAKSRWVGVERVYQDLVKLEVEITARAHQLAGEAARALGDVSAARGRYAVAAVTSVEAREVLEDLDTRYGQVELRVRGARLPVLLRPHMPFMTDERVTIERARAQLLGERRFEGWLPKGTYEIDGHVFEVNPEGGMVQLVVE